MSNSATRKGGGHLVLDDAGADTRADYLVALLDGLESAQVDSHRAVELERPSAGRHFRVSPDYADLLPELVDEHNGRVGAADGGGELPEGLGHEPGLKADVGVAHVALQLRPGHEGRHAVDNDDVHGAAADQVLAYLQTLLCRIGLRNKQVIGVYAALSSVSRVEGMLRIDIGRLAP